jgi:CRP-like cAMP-binding protein
VIFHKTDLSTDLYIVNSGRVKAVLTDDEGDEIVLAQFKSGAFFGELNLLDNKGRSAPIVADEDSELAILKKDVFFDLLYRNPKIAVELMATLVESAAGKWVIETLAFLEVGERLVRTLMTLQLRRAQAAKVFSRVGKLTHKELAARIGSSREAVTKCMKVFSVKEIREAEGHPDSPQCAGTP